MATLTAALIVPSPLWLRCASVPQRMVEFTRRSPRFANVMQDLFAGKQSYLGLKRRLMRNLHGSLYEIAMSVGLGRIVPKAGGA